MTGEYRGGGDTVAPRGPTDGYDIPTGGFDEMQAPDGSLRPHWRHLGEALQRMGPGVLGERSARASRLVRDNGVTYNIYGDPRGETRTWNLDPVPMLLDSDEWAGIESALVQRAELLDRILADLYGPRTLLTRGLLPPEAIFAHPGFQRSCSDIPPAGQKRLVLYAADLVRGADGGMWVLSDRTQAPSGFGYALENRTITAQALPSLFRDSGVHRLAHFFQCIRKALSELAPGGHDQPQIALLTPGPRNETYFEHAFLASYLGYTLVQGEDLLVQDSRLWLMSPGGLRPIDVLLRRLDDDYCDPLELRPDSRLGVPGMAQLARGGYLALANPLGSGAIDNPAILPFLPEICRQLIGQDLRLPTAATWWCGQTKERSHVLENLRRLVVKRIHRRPGEYPVVGSALTRSQLDDLRERIRAEPTLYVGQEPLAFSTTPTFSDGRLVPRRVLLRAFMVGSRSGYDVMPGGLTRVAGTEGQSIVSNQTGGISKDTWVLASEPERPAPAAITIEPPVVTTEAGISNRAADNLFWMGRYCERAEGTARLLRTAARFVSEAEEIGSDAHRHCVGRLLPAVTQVTGTYPGFIARPLQADPDKDRAELAAIATDSTRDGGLSTTLRSLLEAAYSVREFWSMDTWRLLDAVDGQWLAGPRAAPTWEHTAGRLDHLITILTSLFGLARESMIRDDGWLFMDIGRRLERAQMLGSLVRSCLAIADQRGDEELMADAVLSASDSTAACRRRYGRNPSPAEIIELLLLDEDNPRGLRHQTERIAQAVRMLPSEGRGLAAWDRLAIEANTLLSLADGERLVGVTEPPSLRGELDAVLGRSGEILAQLSMALTEAFFQHAAELRQLNDPEQ